MWPADVMRAAPAAIASQERFNRSIGVSIGPLEEDWLRGGGRPLADAILDEHNSYSAIFVFHGNRAASGAGAAERQRTSSRRPLAGCCRLPRRRGLVSA